MSLSLVVLIDSLATNTNLKKGKVSMKSPSVFNASKRYVNYLNIVKSDTKYTS